MQTWPGNLSKCIDCWDMVSSCLLILARLAWSDATCEMSRQPTLAKFGFRKRIEHRVSQRDINLPDFVAETQKKFTCSTCRKAFVNQQGLSVHEQMNKKSNNIIYRPSQRFWRTNMRTETSVTSWWGGKSLRMAGLLVPLSTTTRSWENIWSTTLIILQTVRITWWLW